MGLKNGTMDDKVKTVTDMMVIRHFFFEGEKVAVFSREYKELTGEDKSQLADAIRDGSLTYGNKEGE